MHFATKSKRTQILVWLIWAIACLVFLLAAEGDAMAIRHRRLICPRCAEAPP